MNQIIRERQAEIAELINEQYRRFQEMDIPEWFARQLIRDYHEILTTFMLGTIVEVENEETES